MINSILKYFLKKKDNPVLRWGQKALAVSNRAIKPVHINIEITHRCNLSCFFCPGKFAKDMGPDMTLARFKEALAKLPNLKVITFLGRGETLINPDVYAMVDFARSKGIEAIDIVTNGTLFSEDNIKKLKGVSNFTVSVDSPDTEEYKKMRGFSLSKIEENLGRLNKFADWKPYLTIQMIVTSYNMGKMKDMLDWTKKMGASRCSFVLMMAFEEELDKSNPQFTAEFKEIIKDAVAYAKEIGIDIIAPSATPERRNCFEPWRSVKLALNGDIYPCCYIFESSHDWDEYYKGACRSVNQQGYVMGNIFNNDFDKIWNGPAYKVLRSRVRKNNTSGGLSAEDFSIRRNNSAAGSKERFNYCDCCLFRWQCAC